MTAIRRDGGGNPFGKWVRSQPFLESHSNCETVTDVDWIFQKYRADFKDSLGTRHVQFYMMVEVKTYHATMSDQQRETLFDHHMLLKSKGKSFPVLFGVMRKERRAVRHFGAYVLSLPGEYPEDGKEMKWGIFKDDGNLIWVPTKREMSIVEMLGFKRIPYNPNAINRPLEKLLRVETIEEDVRRHHVRIEYEQSVILPNGIETKERRVHTS